MMISLVLADGHPSTRAGLRAILGGAPDIQILGEAKDGFEVQKLVEQLRPQILLLDLEMPGPLPAEIEKWVRTHRPATVTLILTAHDRDAYLAVMMEAGVAGYLTKNESSERLIDAIRRAAQGNTIFTIEQYARALSWHKAVGAKRESLSGREREILQLLVRGMDSKTIAGRLGISSKTVAYHLTNVYEKLDVNSRPEAIV
jgi:Response regulator containing a CheY-like receiver domain and an HTH DNA-binding domain